MVPSSCCDDVCSNPNTNTNTTIHQTNVHLESSHANLKQNQCAHSIIIIIVFSEMAHSSKEDPRNPPTKEQKEKQGNIEKMNTIVGSLLIHIQNTLTES